MIVVLMGVSGSGKSTVGQRLSKELCWQFEDGDDFHPEKNKSKMAAGHPLNDEDRHEWLLNLHKLIERWDANQQHGIVVCSALKFKYRQVLLCGQAANYRIDHDPDFHRSSSRSGDPSTTLSGDISSTRAPSARDPDPCNSASSISEVERLRSEHEPHRPQEFERHQVDRTSVLFVHLRGSLEHISSRLGHRKGHFFDPRLLQSQFDTLEELRDDENGVVVEVERPLDAVVSEIIATVLPTVSQQTCK